MGIITDSVKGLIYCAHILNLKIFGSSRSLAGVCWVLCTQIRKVLKKPGMAWEQSVKSPESRQKVLEESFQIVAETLGDFLGPWP